MRQIQTLHRRIAGLRKRYRHWQSVALWRLESPKLGFAAEAVVANLLRDSIAVSSVEQLGLQAEFANVANVATARRQKLAEAEDRETIVRTQYKDYFHELLSADDIRNLDAESPFSRFALHPQVTGIANAYLGCLARLQYLNVWLNRPHAEAPKASQLWHRDPGDVSFLRMLVLVSPLSVENGAFTYVRGSHRFGSLRDLDPERTFDGTGYRVNDDAMRRCAPEESWFTATGDPGTVVFADTRGYHKGGFVRQGERLLFCTLWTRWMFYRPPQFELAPSILPANPSRAQRWAVDQSDCRTSRVRESTE